METVIPGTQLSDNELNELLERIKSSSAANKQRELLSQQSFRDWLYEVFSDVALKLGYSLQRIQVFLKNMAIAFETGFEEGRRRACNEGELERQRILRRFENAD